MQWSFTVLHELKIPLVFLVGCCTSSEINKRRSLSLSYHCAGLVCCQWICLAPTFASIVRLPELIWAAVCWGHWQISHQCKWHSASSQELAASLLANITWNKDACQPTKLLPPLPLFYLFLYCCLFCLFFSLLLVHNWDFKSVEGMAKTLFLLIYFHLWNSTKLHFPCGIFIIEMWVLQRLSRSVISQLKGDVNIPLLTSKVLWLCVINLRGNAKGLVGNVNMSCWKL